MGHKQPIEIELNGFSQGRHEAGVSEYEKIFDAAYSVAKPTRTDRVSC